MKALAGHARSGHRSAEKLSSVSGCQSVFEDLLETPLSEFGRMDLGLLNLLCAPTLPGSEDLDIPKCLARLDRLTDQARAFIERHIHNYRRDPTYGHSEAMWRMGMLVTFIKRDFGATYHPGARDDLLAGIDDAPLTDSREVFIHGLLDDDPKRRWGTCASIPVLIAAVARRLRYPVGLALARQHVYAKWEGREVFNIEASGPAGMTVHSDDHYRGALRGGLTPEQVRSGHYLRTLFPAEEFAVFLKHRVWALRDAARYAETFLWSARALQFSPDDPIFPYAAYQCLDIALKHRVKVKNPKVNIPPPEQSHTFFYNAGELLAPHERSLYLTIVGHYREAEGELDAARQAFEDACRQNFHGSNEQRDLQRLLRKHNLKRRSGPLMPPENLGLQRWIKLRCQPQEEAGVLAQVVRECEREGRILMARDALRDLYMIDPCNAEVFQRARELEQHPLFQPQLKAYIEQRRQREQNSKN